jgi:hypothetical protein
MKCYGDSIGALLLWVFEAEGVGAFVVGENLAGALSRHNAPTYGLPASRESR